MWVHPAVKRWAGVTSVLVLIPFILCALLIEKAIGWAANRSLFQVAGGIVTLTGLTLLLLELIDDAI